MLLDLQKLLNSCWSHKTSAWKLKIISDWPQIVGNLHEYARVEKVYDDTLILGVYDTCWMQELHLLTHMIIKKINTHLGSSQIKQIRLKYVQKHAFRKIQLTPTQIITNTHLPSVQESDALQKIHDPELKLAITNFLTRCNRENKKK